ncbi:MAG: PfkB family carbohydrate kinase, partial [Clostridia bacterium]|nr:PfkB family carbohydrate kinase [Clostridia bacterium]
MFDIVAMGELLIDFTMVSADEKGYPVMAAHPGGAPANFLAAANKSGCSTAFIGKVGNDAFGNRLIATLDEIGTHTGGVIKSDEHFTTLAFVTLDETGNREFSFSRKPGADTMLRYEEVDLSLLDGTKLFHFGTLSLTDDPARSTTKRLVDYAKSRGLLISFDPNLRKPL